ncbi:hypothetical protein DPMN_173426 [Dreissena polymorpha]|uniref:Uncharacterized protein n=1 Tax=Dreissena polymorpha TaxID=45954 RepID=A0A9D4E482_DREPO|nr:hypothetical protein DPMN_173426 [Dreissena polymorpha]
MRYRRRKKLARINSRGTPEGQSGDVVKCDVSETSEEIGNNSEPENNGIHFMSRSMFLNGHGSDSHFTTKAVATDEESPKQPDDTDDTLHNNEVHIGPDGSGAHTVEVKSNGAVFDATNYTIPKNYEYDPDGQKQYQYHKRNVQLPQIQPRRLSLAPEYDEWSVTRTTGRNSSGSNRNSFETHRLKIGMIGTLRNARNNRY